MVRECIAISPYNPTKTQPLGHLQLYYGLGKCLHPCRSSEQFWGGEVPLVEGLGDKGEGISDHSLCT